MNIIKYSTTKFNFQRIFHNLLETKNLDRLSALRDEQIGLHNSFYKNMEQQPVFRKMYDNLIKNGNDEFLKLYSDFIRQEVAIRYNEPIYYQKIPSLRILFFNLDGVQRFHRDRDYGHSEKEINYWVPITDAFETNTIWISDSENDENHKPVNLKYGEYIEFNGASLSHGAKQNKTGKTRISFDFRIMLKSDYEVLNLDANASVVSGNPVRDNAMKFISV